MRFIDCVFVAGEVALIMWAFGATLFGAVAAWCVAKVVLCACDMVLISYYPNRSYYPYWERLPYVIGVE